MTVPPFLKSEKLSAAGFVHGFFTRQGGTSEGAFASLNCSYSVGDDPTRVTANIERVSSQLGLDQAHLVTVSQVHGAQVELFEPQGYVPDFRTRLADALTSEAGNYGLAIRTADCMPILIGCQQTGRVAAIHAGWKGVVAQIIGQAVRTMIGENGETRSLIACVGPHISIEAFEVSLDVARILENSSPDGSAAVRLEQPKPHVALGQLAAYQLAAAGVPKENIEQLGACTYLNSKDFFSYRRDGAASGRQLSVIRARPRCS